MSLTERVAWFGCSSGIAGDMALGALLDAGADLEAVRAACEGLGVGGWELSVDTVRRATLSATRAEVLVGTDDHPARTPGDVQAILDGAGLAPRVHARASAVFAALAAAEAEVHGCSPEEVHFHEVGAIDALVDVVGTCAALESLGIDRVAAGRVALGGGTVTADHGVLAVPVPAVARLLRDAPVSGGGVEAELTTPTGAALLAALVTAWGAVPDMALESTGMGAGARDPAHLPNVTQVLVGVARPAAAADELVELETNLDDVTGEVLAHTVARLMDEGARDAWVVPVVMKKGRPAHTLVVLADAALAPALAEVVFAETGTLGVRTHTVQRIVQSRRIDRVEGVGVKQGPHGSKIEFDDAVAAARTGSAPRPR